MLTKERRNEIAWGKLRETVLGMAFPETSLPEKLTGGLLTKDEIEYIVHDLCTSMHRSQNEYVLSLQNRHSIAWKAWVQIKFTEGVLVGSTFVQDTKAVRNRESVEFLCYTMVAVAKLTAEALSI